MDTLPSLISPDRLSTMQSLAGNTPPGAFIEVGVYQGGSAEVLYVLSREQNRELWLYDTFSGIPFKDEIDSHNVGDFSNGMSFETARRVFPRAIVQRGIFPGELMLPGNIAFVHLDCDQYRSYRESLDLLLPKISPGGMILCDDYALAGCAKAIDETDWPRELIEDGRIVFRC
jgi:O-methyltransferase